MSDQAAAEAAPKTVEKTEESADKTARARSAKVLRDVADRIEQGHASAYVFVGLARCDASDCDREHVETGHFVASKHAEDSLVRLQGGMAYVQHALADALRSQLLASLAVDVALSANSTKH